VLEKPCVLFSRKVKSASGARQFLETGFENRNTGGMCLIENVLDLRFNKLYSEKFRFLDIVLVQIWNRKPFC